MTVFAVASILSGTTFPLRVVLYLSALGRSRLPVVCLRDRFERHEPDRRDRSGDAVLSVVTVPLMSLYIVRVYKNVVHRPIFIIDKTRSSL